MGTVYGARAVGLEGKTGVLKPGMKADFIALSTDRPHLVPRTDWVSHLVYAASGADVQHVWADGRQLLRNGALLTLDEEKIRREAQACFDRLRA
jgi:5-methylthioadenosine/S-adenosylhomocysteine deaminase